MVKHILVPLDGSKLSESALPVADYLAQRFGATVRLLHLIERNAPAQVHGEPHLTQETQANTYLAEMAQRRFSPGVAVDYHVHTSEISDVARSIIAHADEFENDLIVMCVHGRGGIQGWMFGSIAQQVVAAGKQPVLLIPVDAEAQVSEFHCGNILVPLDANEQNEQGINPTVELAQACGAAIHLVIVIPTPQTLPASQTPVGRLLPLTTSALLALSEQQAVDYLKAQVEHVQQKKVVVGGSTYRGNPANVIVQVAEQRDADVIVLATHGRTGLDAFLEESVAAKISSRSHIPLLLVRISEA